MPTELSAAMPPETPPLVVRGGKNTMGWKTLKMCGPSVTAAQRSLCPTPDGIPWLRGRVRVYRQFFFFPDFSRMAFVDFCV
jgi:hypothetical protein